MTILCLFLISIIGSIKKDYIYYEPGLPKDLNEGMKKLLYKFTFYYNEVPKPNDDKPTFATFFLSSEEKPDKMYFFEYAEEPFNEEYEKLNDFENGPIDLNIMQSNMEDHFTQLHPYDVGLPEIKLKEDRYLIVTNQQDDLTVDLEKMGKSNLEIGSFFINVLDNTEEDMLIHLTSFNLDYGEGLLVLVKKDFSDSYTVKDGQTDIEEAYESGELDSYSSLFKSVGTTERYKIFSNKYESYILDEDQKELFQIDPKDELSQDGEYVLIGGASPTVGTHRIQKVEDYLMSQEDKAREFVIDAQIIAKLSEFDKSVKLDDIVVPYFRNDFIIYRLEYILDEDTERTMSVLVDLSDPDSTPYLFQFW